jgi:crotonobetainyl-CoA:carnitine CoA-transferase CaiB-like acyl-CoA transferase
MPPAGSTGPWSDLLSYGPTLTGLNGMKAVHGYPEDGAVMEEAADLDPISAGYGAPAMLAALMHRAHTGEGQFVELAQARAGFAGLAEGVIEWTWNGRDIGPVGNSHRFLAPHGIYQTAGDDQWIAIACDSDEQWQALARVAGRPGWLERENFATAEGRRAARQAIDAEIGSWTAGEDKRELTERLQAAGVPAFPVLNSMEVIADPAMRERRADFVRPPEFPADELLNGVAWHLSKTPPRLRRPGPEFGAHNVEVLGEYLGMSEAEVHDLEEAGLLE